ncbi:tRNA pseudouridine(13) synthase TruD [Elongatibacter sediminis]|uniref:tRNA pseudouridine synthase D n=1 Tax=Elongatibacter sediminis TaxID=3119006 RepID=A0AAW9RK04_9GAMM
MHPEQELAAFAAAGDWPRALGEPGVRAVIREVPEDFEVEEIARITPAGAGDHLWLWVEKRGANTTWVADQLARAAGCRSGDVGFAGMKDRHAVTRQWYSVPAPGRRDLPWREWQIEGVTVIDGVRHDRKLRRGTLTGNAFRIVLARPEGDLEGLVERMRRIADAGLPNYFGEQRFGHGGDNVRRGADWLRRGGRIKRARRSIYLSAVRSALFNRVLACRVDAGCWNRLMPGEIAMLDGSRSVFPCDNLDESLETRCRELDIHPTGPLPGRDGMQPTDESAALENSVLAPYEALTAALSAAGVDAGRRALRVCPRNAGCRFEEGDAVLRFELPAGAYATAVLRELVTPVR